MDRRRFVTASGLALCSALAGCVESDETDDTGETDDRSDSGSDSDTKADEDSGVVYEVTSQTSTEGRPLEHDVELTSPALGSSEQPLTLEVTLKNTTDEELAYGERRDTRLLYQYDEGFGLVAEGDDRYEFEEETGWWVPVRPLERTDDYQIGTLEPGERTTQRLVLIVSREDRQPEGYPERFSFDVEFRVGDEGHLLDDGERYDWGVVLEQTD